MQTYTKHILFILLIIILASRSLISPQIVESLTITETSAYYVIENDKYTVMVSRTNGMVESLKLIGSDFELAADYPHYSIFFPEFLYEYPNGRYGQFYDATIDSVNVKTKARVYDNLIIIEAIWDSGMINSRWEYFFEPDEPYFRVSITRKVALEGIYSNFQQCTMYNPDMDNSLIINYQGQLELTTGEYTGVRPYVAPFREGVDYLVTIAQHSLWTVFDYDKPTYFPTIAWSDNESNIHAGIVVTFTSPNQRETISYHGGGFHRPHPGYAEAQFNWFGKSDSESLYLREGLEFSMELYFYQNYGSIDSLLNFSENLLSQKYHYFKPVNYAAASWGGRTSTTDYYYWRYPQVSSNYINSQELLRHKGFAIPRSQNGTMDIHLFSLNLVNIRGDQKTELTPVYGTTPLFDSLYIDEDEISYTGGMCWKVKDFNTTLSYTAYPNQHHVTVAGEVQSQDAWSGDNFIELPLSSRTKELYVDAEDMFFSFISPDPILDTVSIGLTNIAGVDSFIVRADTLLLRMIETVDGRSEFRFDLYPMTQKAFRGNSQISEIENSSPQPYKAYFVNKTGNSGISFLPASEYFVFNDHRIDDILTFALYASCDFDSLLFAADIERDPMVFIRSRDQRSARRRLECNENKYKLRFPFKGGSLYHIEISGDNVKIKQHNSDKGDTEIELLEITPNPFNDVVTIHFSLSTSDYVYYEIYNIQGERILESPKRFYFNGHHEITIDLSSYSSAVYFCKIATSSTTRVRKLVLIK